MRERDICDCIGDRERRRQREGGQSECLFVGEMDLRETKRNGSISVVPSTFERFVTGEAVKWGCVNAPGVGDTRWAVSENKKAEQERTL